jgi:SAM-dependent methyltransferase
MMRPVRGLDHGEASATGGRTLEMFADTPRLNAWMYAQLAERVRGDVLEVGSGIGNLSRFIAEDAQSCVLTDMEESYVARLEQKFAGTERVRAVRWALGDDPPEAIASRAFDAIVAVNVIEHVEDDAGACRTLASLLRPGGHLLAYVPSCPFAYGTLDEALGHYRRYTRGGFEGLLAGAGLEVVESRRMNPLGLPGWLLNGRLLRKRVLPARQVALFDRMVWLARIIDRLPIPVGLGVVAHAVRRS